MSSSGRRSSDGGGVLEGSWLWVTLPVGVLGLIAALWFLVIAPSGGAPLRATATPAQSATVEPTVTLAAIAEPADSAQPTEAPTTLPTAAPGTYDLGTRVEVAGTGVAGLRVREDPGTDTVTLEFVTDGTKFFIVGGPQQADDMTWWKVDDQSGTIGWVAGQYIVLAQ